MSKKNNDFVDGVETDLELEQFDSKGQKIKIGDFVRCTMGIWPVEKGEVIKINELGQPIVDWPGLGHAIEMKPGKMLEVIDEQKQIT